MFEIRFFARSFWQLVTQTVRDSRKRGYTGKWFGGELHGTRGLPPGQIWVRIGARSKYEQRPATAVYNGVIGDEPGVAVVLEEITGGYYEIYSLDMPRAARELGSAVNNAATPTRDGRQVNEVVRGDVFLPGRVKRKRNTDGSQDGLFVTIEAFSAGGVDFPTQNVELAPTSTASSKAWVALYGLPDDGQIHQALGDDHALTDTMTRAHIFDEVTFPEGAVRLWAYVLENGQTALASDTQNEDIREFLNAAAQTGGGGTLNANNIMTDADGSVMVDADGNVMEQS